MYVLCLEDDLKLPYLKLSVFLSFWSIHFGQNSLHTIVNVSYHFPFFFFFFFFFFMLYLQHMEVPGLGLESELPLQACVTAMETPDLSHICDLCHMAMPDP